MAILGSAVKSLLSGVVKGTIAAISGPSVGPEPVLPSAVDPSTFLDNRRNKEANKVTALTPLTTTTLKIPVILQANLDLPNSSNLLNNDQVITAFNLLNADTTSKFNIIKNAIEKQAVSVNKQLEQINRQTVSRLNSFDQKYREMSTTINLIQRDVRALQVNPSKNGPGSTVFSQPATKLATANSLTADDIKSGAKIAGAAAAAGGTAVVASKLLKGSKPTATELVEDAAKKGVKSTWMNTLEKDGKGALDLVKRAGKSSVAKSLADGLKGGILGAGILWAGGKGMDLMFGTPESNFQADVQKYGVKKAMSLYKLRGGTGHPKAVVNGRLIKPDAGEEKEGIEFDLSDWLEDSEQKGSEFLSEIEASAAMTKVDNTLSGLAKRSKETAKQLIKKGSAIDKVKAAGSLGKGAFSTLKGGIVGGALLYAGETAVDKIFGTPDEAYEHDVEKYGKDKAEQLYKIRGGKKKHGMEHSVHEMSSLRPPTDLNIFSKTDIWIKSEKNVKITAKQDLTLTAANIILDGNVVMKNGVQLNQVNDILVGGRYGATGHGGVSPVFRPNIGGGGRSSQGTYGPTGHGGISPVFRHGIGGNRSSRAHVSKNLATNQDEAYKALRAQGMSDDAARAMVANISGESLANPSDYHFDKSHMAQGIVQWDPTRSAAIKAHFGTEPKDMSVADQMKAYVWELKTNPAYAKSWHVLNDPKASGQQMVETLVSNYERPADAATAIRQRLNHLDNLDQRMDTPQTEPQGQQTTDITKMPVPTTKGTPRYNWISSQDIDPRGDYAKNNIVTINTAYGQANVNRKSAVAFQGYFADLKAAGAPIHKLGSYALRGRKSAGPGHHPGTGWSEHSFGNAIDMDDAAQLSPEMAKWMQENSEKFASIKQKWGIKQGIHGDAPHTEFGGVISPEAAKQVESQRAEAVKMTSQKESKDSGVTKVEKKPEQVQHHDIEKQPVNLAYSINKKKTLAMLRSNEPMLQSMGAFVSDDTIWSHLTDSLNQDGIKISASGQISGDPSKITKAIDVMKKRYPHANIDRIISTKAPPHVKKAVEQAAKPQVAHVDTPVKSIKLPTITVDEPQKRTTQPVKHEKKPDTTVSHSNHQASKHHTSHKSTKQQSAHGTDFESAPAKNGSMGYGNQKQDNERVGICSV